MGKLVVIPNNKDEINILSNKNITEFIIGVKDLSIYNFELGIEEIIELKKELNINITIAINKMIHNSDLDYVKKVLLKVKNTGISILFQDLGVFNIIKDLKLNNKLIIYGEHLNLSIGSNSFYKEQGINSTYISSDITYREINNIKDRTMMEVYYTVYGYLPIFYSRRRLITNYFKYIDKDKEDDNYYIFDKDNKYMIKEKEYGTIIYSPLVNLINEMDKIMNIDNYVIDLSYTDDLSIIDKFINNEKVDNTYTGFFDRETIFKLKEEE